MWLTVATSADRFICVRFPLHAASLCTCRRACLVALALPPVSLALNVPRFFLYRVVLHENVCSGRIHFDVRWLDIPTWFKLTFFEVFEAAFFFVIPLLLLLFLNGALIQSLTAASRKRFRMVLRRAPIALHGTRPPHALKRDQIITLTLIAVVTMFIVFETPSAFLNIAHFVLNVSGQQDVWETFWTNETVMIGLAISMLLALLNSSTNFFLYSVVNSNFRRTLFAILFVNNSKHNANGAATIQNTMRRQKM